MSDSDPSLNETLFYDEIASEALRLDTFLSQHFSIYSRSFFQKLIQDGLVIVNGAIAKKRTLLQLHDQIEVAFPLPGSSEISGEEIPLEILYEDNYLLIINKPSGLVVHPGAGNRSGTVLNALIHHCAQSSNPILPESFQDPSRPGIVHRLDKDTSGLLILAKTQVAHQRLVELLANRQITKTYLAITSGCTNLPSRIEGRIGRAPADRQKMHLYPMDSPQGRSSLSYIKILDRSKEFNLIAAYPYTGRTHQIRVHLASVNAPILGDQLYANSRAREQAARHMLHAYGLKFIHPITSQPISINAPLPEDFKHTLAKCSLQLPSTFHHFS
jgi:23S rRNA pseudouridine1911/1915/1917 synthase